MIPTFIRHVVNGLISILKMPFDFGFGTMTLLDISIVLAFLGLFIWFVKRLFF
ncbi:MAG: hypothetical protein QXI16_07100 [Sulfolobaceae archaeon]